MWKRVSVYGILDNSDTLCGRREEVTWASRERVCCRSWAHPLPVDVDMISAAGHRMCLKKCQAIRNGLTKK